MKHFLTPFCFCLILTPTLAQETPPDAQSDDVEEGFSLVEEGAKLLLRGLMNEMEPALDEMGQALKEMRPEIQKLIEMIGDFRNYHPPEMQPNGDIIIRRKTPSEILEDQQNNGEIEL